VIDKARRFVHRRVEPQIFVSKFPILVALRRRHADDDFVRMNGFDRPFLVRSIDENFIAGFYNFGTDCGNLYWFQTHAAPPWIVTFPG